MSIKNKIYETSGQVKKYFDESVSNAHQKEIQKILDQTMEIIDRRDPSNNKRVLENLSDSQLKSMTSTFRKKIQAGSTLDELLPSVYAVAYEASRRTLGISLYKSQIATSIALHRGVLAELPTGEGKTYSLLPTAYLHALSKEGREHGVHIYTSNDYLAKRDSELVEPFFNAVGLYVSHAAEEYRNENNELLDENERNKKLKYAYNADIVYSTAATNAFSYLRDSTVTNARDKVMRGFYFGIIDEADSILLDESTNPFIITRQLSKFDSTSYMDVSSFNEEQQFLYKEAQRFVESVYGNSSVYNASLLPYNKDVMGNLYQTSKKDCIVSLHDGTCTLTDAGENKLIKFIKGSNIPNSYKYSYDNETNKYAIGDFRFYIQNALKANFLFNKNDNYVIDSNSIKLINSLTKRIEPGKKLSDGLHQAIEAKEGVAFSNEQRTVSRITHVNFLGQYQKLAGMSGTLMTSSKEFKDLYHMDVVKMNPNKPNIREDHLNELYATKAEKNTRILKKVLECKKNGRPILVGVNTIAEANEMELLLRKYVPNLNVLTAINHEQEASIISQAGCAGAVTIVTPIAGRGTDIKLGGDLETLAKNSKGLIEFAKKYVSQEDLLRYASGEYRRSLKSSGEKIYYTDTDLMNRYLSNDQSAENIKLRAAIDIKKKEILDFRAIVTLDKIENGELGTDVLNEYHRAVDKSIELLKQDPNYIKDRKRIVDAGGLCILGTSMSHSERVDSQLRGRAGRQGDPGESIFVTSLEDPFFTEGIFSSNIPKYKNAVMKDHASLEIQKLIRTVQQNYEAISVNQRRENYGFNIAEDMDRKSYSKTRDAILQNDPTDIFMSLASNSLDVLIKKYCTDGINDDSLRTIQKKLKGFLPKDVLDTSPEEFKDTMLQTMEITIKKYQNENPLNGKLAMRKSLLTSSDSNWVDYLDQTENRRMVARLQTYAQKDPGLEYSFMSRDAFKEFVDETSIEMIADTLNYCHANSKSKIALRQNSIFIPEKRK